MENPVEKIDERMEDMEAGLATPPGAFMMAKSLWAGDEETETTSQHTDMDIEMSVDGPAAAAEPRDVRMVELAVAATAAVELSNLFFLLRGESELHRRRRKEIPSVTATEALAVLAAFAAFLSAAGLLLSRHAAGGGGQRVVVPAARRRVILVASAASLFVASVATAVSLLCACGLPPR
ncbi:hypothetical protein EJB05_24441, partial [Eragrostis curvula]